MKFVAISMVKNEADIIELFIRINSRVIDHFFIVDHGSTDRTRFILEKLRQEGFNITIYEDKSKEYKQSLTTSKALRSAAHSTLFDWAFILDADEFINIPKEELEKELSNPLPEGCMPCIQWSTWVPNGDQYYDYTNPLWSVFRKKRAEESEVDKVIVPYKYAKVCVLDTGNHRAFYTPNGGYDLNQGVLFVHKYKLVCGKLDHVPIRSSEQATIKIMTGCLQMFTTKGRVSSQGYHWDRWADIIMGNNCEVDDIMMRYIALQYTEKEIKEIPNDDVDQDSRLGLETDHIKYKNLCKINEKASMYQYMYSLALRLREKL